jgi:fatty-acid desaturase
MKAAKLLGKIDVTVRSLTLLTVVKWLGTIGVIVAAILRAFGYHVEDMIVGSIGTALWAYAAYKGRDTALLTCNLFILTVLIYGIVKGVGA